MFIIFIFIVKSTINFEGNKWVHTSIDKDGKKSVVTRYIDDKGQQMIVSHFHIFFYSILMTSKFYNRIWNVVQSKLVVGTNVLNKLKHYTIFNNISNHSFIQF